jgi:hypothetical protein
MNTRSTQSGAAWLPIIIVLAIIVIGAGIWMYGQPATTPSDTATTTDSAMDQGANAGAAVDITASTSVEVTDEAAI